MRNPSIPQAVLSENLQDVIKGRRVKVAVFLSFQFDPGFFEEEILPVLFSQSFSHVPKIRLLQLEETLRQVQRVAVYYDRSGLAADAQPAKLDYRRIGLSRSTGIFHPKNIFLLLENSQDEASGESLLVVTLSANLTRAGWWENVEVAHLEEVQSGEPCSLRPDLLDLIRKTKQADKTRLEHSALNAIRAFLYDQVDKDAPQKRNRRWQPRLYVGKQSVPDFLQTFITRYKFNLEIISPYFDETGTAGALRQLLKTLNPQETRLLLPEGKDGAALCREGYYEAVEQLGAAWSRLPSGPLQPPATDKSGKSYRFVHAKVYRFWNQKREIFFVGSVNLTQAAHQSSSGGNLETAILFESENSNGLGWWLEPIDAAKPTDFRPEKSEDAALDERAGKLSLRFDWESGQLDYFWESSRGSKPQQASISSQGVALFSIDPIEFDEWTTLPHTQAKLIEELLNATSVVDVSTDEGPLFRILIQEEDMAHKPSMLLTLTAEEILRYWSLLSAEQREAFINDRAGDLAIGTEISLPAQKLRGEETMFDRFAGIFHAFGRLEHHTAFQELAKFAENFDLILAVNVPTVRDEPLSQLSRTFGQLLGRQTPIGGMSGGVNQSLVRQFRMPGYPLLLVTTDVLQEGEDLHTFCANVIHYGISWTPSAMEQRTGRIDRIQSLTQRRLDNKSEAEEDKKLQVYYPHLKETVERLQVERVYERMNRFIRLMHRSFSGEMLTDSQINTAQAMVSSPRDIKPITEPLETLFPVKKDEWLYPERPSKQIEAKVETAKVFDHFKKITESLGSLFKIKAESQSNEPWSFLATVFVLDGQLAAPDEPKTLTTRQQPFTLFLRTARGDGRVLLRCVSPIGFVGRDDDEAIERICTAQQELGSGKICAVDDTKLNRYNLTVETDILFHPDTTQLEEVADLIARTTRCADHMEKALLSVDKPMSHFRDDLSEVASCVNSIKCSWKS